jgi:hypothetical protein
MPKSVTLTLSSIGTSNGTSFSIYTDADGYVTPIATSVTASDLLSGYSLPNVPDAATLIKVQGSISCGLQPAAGITITGLAPTNTPTPTPTVTPTPTPVVVSTPTPTPTPTVTPTPTPTSIPAVSVANKIVLQTTLTNICGGTAAPTLYMRQSDYDVYVLNGIQQGMILYYNALLDNPVQDRDFAYDIDFSITRPISSTGVLGDNSTIPQC